MVNFNDVILILEKAGVADVLLPFILIFTIVFAITERIHLFSKQDKDGDGNTIYTDVKKFHAVLALVIGMAVVIPHVTNSYPNPKYDIVNIINISLPNVSVIIVAVIAGLILLATFGVKFRPGPNSIISIILWVLSIGAIAFVFGNAAGWSFKLPRFLGFLNNKDTQALLIIGLVFTAIISFITKPSLTEEERKERIKKRNENHKNMMKYLYDYQGDK